MAAYRASRHDATGFSPNYLMFGRELRAPIGLVLGGPNGSDYATSDEFLDMVRAGLLESYALAREI